LIRIWERQVCDATGQEKASNKIGGFDISRLTFHVSLPSTSSG